MTDKNEEKQREVKFCVSELGLKNNQKSGFTTSNPICKAKSVQELVKMLVTTENLRQLKKSAFFVEHYNLIIAKINDVSEAMEAIESWLEGVIKTGLEKKRNLRMNMNNEAQGHFGYEYEPVQELNQDSNFNTLDSDLFNNVYYCPLDNYIYIKSKDNLLPYGTFENVAKNIQLNNFSRDLKTLMLERCKLFGIVYDESKLNDALLLFLNYAKEKTSWCIRLVDNQLHAIQQNYVKNPPESWYALAYDENMHQNPDVDNDNMINELVVCPTKYVKSINNPNACDIISRNVATELFLSMVPLSIVSMGYILPQFRYNVSYDESGEKLKILDGMSWKFTKFGSIPSDEFWIGELFQKCPSLIKKNVLVESPKTYSDDADAFAIYHSNEENLNDWCERYDCYNKLEDCVSLTTLKSWMSDFEFKATMAWCYSALYPTKAPSEIALFLHTGGGTGKSTLYRILEYAMSALTKTDPSAFSQRLLGSVFDKEDYNTRNPDGEVGIVKAAIINIDEATTTSLELFKDFSGTPGANKITGRKVFSTATSQISYAKWLFTSNKYIDINGDDGSYQRRIAIIEHPEVNNIININGMTSDKFDVELKKQVKMLIEIGKKCYEELTSDGKSLDEVFMTNPELLENLRKSVGTEANEDVWEEMKKLILDDCVLQGSEYRIGNNLINKLYERASQLAGTDNRYVSSFKKWLKNKVTYKIARNVECLDEQGSTIMKTVQKAYVIKQSDINNKKDK